MEILQNFLGWLLDRSGSLPDLHGSLSQIWWLQIISLFGPYALIMTVLFCLNFLYEKWRPEGKFHPQQESFRRHAHLFFYLMGSNLLGLTLILIPMLVLDRLHLVKIYANKAQYGMPYFYASFFLLLIVHDAYFYGTHYILHRSWIYRKIHFRHHLSKNVNPLSSLYFHPVESLVHHFGITFSVMLIPVHPQVLTVYFIYFSTIAVLAHSGFDYYPRLLKKGKWPYFLVNCFHHYIHHEFGDGNCCVGMAFIKLYYLYLINGL